MEGAERRARARDSLRASESARLGVEIVHVEDARLAPRVVHVHEARAQPEHHPVGQRVQLVLAVDHLALRRLAAPRRFLPVEEVLLPQPLHAPPHVVGLAVQLHVRVRGDRLGRRARRQQRRVGLGLGLARARDAFRVRRVERRPALGLLFRVGVGESPEHVHRGQRRAERTRNPRRTPLATERAPATRGPHTPPAHARGGARERFGKGSAVLDSEGCAGQKYMTNTAPRCLSAECEQRVKDNVCEGCISSWCEEKAS